MRRGFKVRCFRLVQYEDNVDLVYDTSKTGEVLILSITPKGTIRRFERVDTQTKKFKTDEKGCVLIEDETL